MFKAALSRTFDILVALVALVLLYWPVLRGVTGGVRGARRLFWDLWRRRHGKRSAVCRSGESSWISVQFTTKARRKCWMAPSTPAWKTHIRATSQQKEMEKENMCARAHIYAHSVDFALHKVIYYGTWQSLTNTHAHTQSQTAISHLCSCMMWPSRRVPGGKGATKETYSTSSLYTASSCNPCSKTEENCVKWKRQMCSICNLQAPVCTPVTSVF